MSLDPAIEAIQNFQGKSLTKSLSDIEALNPNPNSNNSDRVFVSHIPTASSATNGEFDDIVIWLSPNILFGKMVAAGKLP